MADNSIWLVVDGCKVRTLRDVLPDTPGLKALFVAKTPAPVSVEAGHYFQGKQGRMFLNRLKRYGLLKPSTRFEDDSFLYHGFGLTDIVKVPREYGSEPSSADYAAGIDRVLDLVHVHKPIVVVFVYKRVLDEVLSQRFGTRTKSSYGFNPPVDQLFGSRVFAFPLPGTPCRASEADRAMRELACVLGQESSAPAPGASRPPRAIGYHSAGRLAPYEAAHSRTEVEKGAGDEMRSTQEVAELIMRRFKAQGRSHVPGYNSFGFVQQTDRAVIVSREAGQDTRIPVSKIEQAVSAVRSDPAVYDAGPSRLREHGITHINSVLWSLLHLVSKSEIFE